MSSTPANGTTPVQAPPPGVLSDFSHPVDFPRRDLEIATLVICVFLSTLSVLMRLHTRLFVVRMIGWDDAFAVIAMGLNFGLTASFVGQINTGLAFIPWNVSLDEYTSKYLGSWIYWNTIFTLLLYIIFPVIKLSILAFYLRILGLSNQKYRNAIWALIAFMVAVLVATVAALLQMCNPPAALFNINIQATCNISGVIFVVQAALQVLTDFLCLLPPIPFVISLNLSPMRKAQVLVPICIGFAVTGIGIARLAILIEQLNAPSAAIDLESWQGTYLAIIEINFAIIAVCLPALNQMFKRARAAVTTMRSKHTNAGKATAPTAGIMSGSRKNYKNMHSYPGPHPADAFAPGGDIELLYEGKSTWRIEEGKLDKSESLQETETEIRHYEPAP